MPAVKGVNIDNIGNYRVEDFAKLIIESKIDKKDLTNKIKLLNLDSTSLNKALQKISFAYERISKPLDNDQIILFIIFPFGIVNRLYENDFFDVQKNIEQGFVKKVNEYYKYSFLGLSIYIIIIIIFYFF